MEPARAAAPRAALGIAAVAALVLLTGSRDPAPPAGPTTPRPGVSIERGRYLTHDVAMCVQCHSPREQDGRIIPSQEFRGAPLPLLSPYPTARFALTTPNLRELALSDPEAIVRLLRTGIARDGNAPDLPMPPFRMTAEDADSIALYLRSLD
ncbi:MAG TPA: c-type cytochrome [Thermoanaerobaculia bacterium]|nr:c-type cytochrome [Thermoanaerobaculia bacterium]